MWLYFILCKFSGKTVTEERSSVFLQEVTESDEDFGDDKSRCGEKQPERIAIKMLMTCIAVLFETNRLEIQS